MHLVGFTIEIYYDARHYERQRLHVLHINFIPYGLYLLKAVSSLVFYPRIVFESLSECCKNPPHCHVLVVKPAFFFVFCLETPKAGSGPTNW